MLDFPMFRMILLLLFLSSAKARSFMIQVESTDANFINLHHISCFCKIAKEFSMKLIANNFDSLSAGRATEQKLIFQFNHKNDP